MIQHENRLLLKKMLQIDLKPSRLSKKVLLSESSNAQVMLTATGGTEVIMVGGGRNRTV